MGSNDERMGKPPHSVTIKTFVLAKYEVTQRQWKAVMGSNPSKFRSCGDSCPVESVSWNDIQLFLKKLNAKSGKTYRLPSEAEWEYACKAGGSYRYCGSDNANDVAWYEGNSRQRPNQVAQLKANAFGLFDMSGNVWEWVQDCYRVDYHGAPSDGSAWTEEGCDTRVVRGGTWENGGIHMNRAAYRGNQWASNRVATIGFRIARNVPQ